MKLLLSLQQRKSSERNILMTSPLGPFQVLGELLSSFPFSFIWYLVIQLALFFQFVYILTDVFQLPNFRGAPRFVTNCLKSKKNAAVTEKKGTLNM